MKLHSRFFPCSYALFLLLAAACGDPENSGPHQPHEQTAAIVSFEATPSKVVAGGEVELSWETTNAVEISLSRNGAAVDLEGAAPASGSLTLAIFEESVFELVAAGARGEPARRSLTVQLAKEPEEDPIIVVFEAVNSSPGFPGQQRELRWEVQGATEVLLTNQDGFEQRFTGAQAAAGTTMAPVGAEGRFRLIASNDAGTATKEFQIPLEDLPIIGLFMAEKDSITARQDGWATASLSWAAVEQATALRLEGDTIEPVEIDSTQIGAGSISVEIAAETRFTLVATNAAGETASSVVVRVAPLPLIGSFTVLPAYVGPGDTVDIVWTTTGVTSVALTQNGLTIPGDHGPNGAVSVPAETNSSFELTAYNDAGDFDSRTAHVTVGQPLIASFDATPSSVWRGESIVFNWETLGGSTLEIASPAGVICSKSDRAEVIAGSCVSAPLAEAGSFDFTLRLENGVGQVATEQRTVHVGDGPRLSEFSVTPPSLMVGEPVSVTWSAVADPDGVEPTLALTANRGGPFSLPAGLIGSTTFSLAEAGSYDFTLTATTSSPGSTPATSTVHVDVYGIPEVTLDANPPIVEPETQGGVTLSWTSVHADLSLVLYELDEAGAPTELQQIAAVDRGSGSFNVGTPTRHTTYRLVATNGLNLTAQADVKVNIAGPEILSFDISPPTYPLPPAPPTLAVVGGDAVQLDWTSSRATSVELSFLEKIEVIEGAAPYVDVAAIGGSRLLLQQNGTTSSAGDEGSAVLFFPAGFTFPFGGTTHTSIVAHANGFASFDIVGALNPITPEPWRTEVQLPVFGDDLVSTQSGGSVYWLHGMDQTSELEYVIVQWKGIEGWRSIAGDLNFELVLWETGDFEYRYGTMYSPTNQGRADGNYALIGFHYQSPSPTTDWLNTRVGLGTGPGFPGGLSNRGFTFRVPELLPLQGGRSWTPRSGDTIVTRTATLLATSLHGEDSATVSVDVHPRAFVRISGPSTALRNEEFTLGWSIRNATALEIRDELGAQPCTVAANQVATGSCKITETVAGPRTYTLTATGALGHKVSETFHLDVVSVDFGIRSFEVSQGGEPVSEAIYGQPVTLSWETGDADRLEITANGVALVLPPTVSVDQDSFTIPSLQEDTTFVLTITNATDGTVASTRTVVVRTFSLDLQASALTVPPGTPIDLVLTVGSHTGAAPKLVTNWPMQETTGAGMLFSDLDISLNPGRVQLIGANDNNGIPRHDFPSSFTFPFMGGVYTAAAVGTNGIISFDAAPPTTNHTNTAIPTTHANNRKLHLLPFWDDLNTWTNGRVHAALVDSNTYVIQWSKLSAAGGAAATEYDLNFMVVLRSDGTFEYRYGTMNPRTGTSTACFPNTCVNEAMGSSATIGYQNTTGTKGSQLHFGGTGGSVANVPFSGGLANRSFRFTPAAASGTTTFVPVGVQTFEVCAELAGFEECKSVTVDAALTLASFEVSKGRIQRGDSVEISWASRGSDSFSVTANGTPIANETSHAAAAGTMILSPTETTTYVLEIRNSHLNRTLTSTKTVVVDQFTFDVTASSTDVSPSTPVTLSWDVSRLSPGTMALTTPLVDVSGEASFRDISTEPGVVTLFQPEDVTTIVDYPFDQGAPFHYLGTSYTSVRVSRHGYLSFAGPMITSDANVPLPNSSDVGARVHLAPFWDGLSLGLPGKILAARVGSDTIIQWSHVSLTQGREIEEHDLNFQVVLSSNGSFEFRYGLMRGLPSGVTSPACFPSTCEREANGSSATIGYQDPTGRAGDLLHFGGTNNASGNFAIAGALTGRAFRFTPASSPGSAIVRPTDSRSYTICAIASGFLECSTPVSVQARWEIVSFAPNAPAIPWGEDVELSWVTTGGDAIIIKSRPSAGGGDVTLPMPPGAPAGSYKDTVLGATIYTLELHSQGRVKTMETTVVLRDVKVELTTEALVVLPNEAVTLSWDVTTDTWITDQPAISVPIFEVPQGPGTRFSDSDISNHPAVVLLTGGGDDDGRVTHPFPAGFSFPYFGTNQTSAIVSTNGWVSFDFSYTSEWSFEMERGNNVRIPAADVMNRTIHLAPFWDNLHTRSSGRIYGALVDANTYVIQWSHISSKVGSDNNNEFDLNFQIVLHSNGSFEYRFGTMTPVANPVVEFGSECVPGTCVNEVAGSSATIGFQDPTGQMGTLLHFGGSFSLSSSVPFKGGLANRTFRASPVAKGSAVVSLTEDQSFTVCASLTSYSECQTVDVLVAQPGDIQISELQIDPTGGVSKQWFEVRNLRSKPYDIGRMVVHSGSTSHPIAAAGGRLLIPAEGHVVLAADAAPGGFTPDYVYGNAFTLGATGDVSLSLGGTTLALAAWDSSWQLPSGGSLMLDDAMSARGTLSHPFSAWCPGSERYDGTNLGSPGLGEGCSYVLNRSSSMPAIDISATGTPLPGFTGQNVLTQIPGGLGFEMPYFGGTVSDLWVSSNGFVSFTPLMDPYALNRSIPQAAAPFGGVVAPYWSYLAGGMFGADGKWQRLEIGSEDVVVIQWITRRLSNHGLGSVTFQLQLWESGDIVFVYEAIDPTSTAQHWGAAVTIGIEDVGGGKGYQYSYLKPFAIEQGQSIHYRKK